MSSAENGSLCRGLAGRRLGLDEEVGAGDPERGSYSRPVAKAEDEEDRPSDPLIEIISGANGRPRVARGTRYVWPKRRRREAAVDDRRDGVGGICPAQAEGVVLVARALIASAIITKEATEGVKPVEMGVLHGAIKSGPTTREKGRGLAVLGNGQAAKRDATVPVASAG